MSSAFRDLTHLAKRFAGALLAQPLDIAESNWVASQLLPGEQKLWNRMSVADQRHAYGVGRRVLEALGDEATRPVLAAALLHDIGKIESGLGTFGRSAATVLANVGARSTKVMQYRAHNEIGQKLLEAAGSDPFTSKWAYEHEVDKRFWTTDAKLAEILYEADDD